MLSSVDFPAPEGPRIAVSSLDLNCPLSPFRISFDSVNLNYKKSSGILRLDDDNFFAIKISKTLETCKTTCCRMKNEDDYLKDNKTFSRSIEYRN